eukprot:m.165713 g.165713  ORF g.165713 m.165713 type:complete len:299 (-) comp16602_c0_seq3:1758-2654(-)
MAAEHVYHEAVTTLGAHGISNLECLDIQSNNPHKFIGLLRDGTKCFIKLCSADELHRTQTAMASAPEATLPFLVDPIKSHQQPDSIWVIWPQMDSDGYNAVLKEVDLELAWQRFGACWQVLAEFHAQGLTHGDCKLENFMFDKNDRAWLIDFECLGGDRGSANSKCLGTPAFAAPECWQNKCGHEDCEHHDFNQSVDVFSLAASFLIRFGIDTPAYKAKLDAEANALPYIPTPSCPVEVGNCVTDCLLAEKSKLKQIGLWKRIEDLVTNCCNADPSTRWEAYMLVTHWPSAACEEQVF